MSTRAGTTPATTCGTCARWLALIGKCQLTGEPALGDGGKECGAWLDAQAETVRVRIALKINCHGDRAAEAMEDGDREAGCLARLHDNWCNEPDEYAVVRWIVADVALPGMATAEGFSS